MAFFSIGYPDRERVEVTLIGKPADPKTKDFDWITADVEIAAGGFKGIAQIYMCVSDMLRFKEELEPVYETVAGVAEFKTIENQLYIRVEGDGLGHINASGFLIDTFEDGNKLTFNIHYDQTLLWHTISEIDEALFEVAPKTAQQIIGPERG
ncbi:MAG TPA: hypothetical protein VN951_03270 [Pyrinomonadaceae bacterium]|nr:hypothetical protein [Pyrinomonadaceae bacterium]